jgi:hypothetical protein
MSDRPSRLRQFLVMLPFFLVGVGLPVYFYGFSGDGPPNLTPERYSPVTTMAPAPVVPAPSGDPYAQSGDQAPGVVVTSSGYARPAGIVMFMRGIFEGFVDRYVSTDVSPASIMLVAFLGLFGLMFMAVRVLLALVTGAIGGVLSFVIHKAAAPMFMGFLAVGSTWGIHQTVAQEFGMTWAATTVTLTAAVASLFALAGVKIR